MEDAQAAFAGRAPELDGLQEQAHAIQVETLKLAGARSLPRAAGTDRRQAEMLAEEGSENERRSSPTRRSKTARGIRELQLGWTAHAQRFEQAERALRDEREQVNGMSSANCVKRSFRSGMPDQDRRNHARPRTGVKQIERIVDELARCAENAEAMQAEDLEPKLQEALETTCRERTAMAAARDAPGSGDTGLREPEEQRMRVEHGLEPQRERIGELRLKEQAASLNSEQLAAQLAEGRADEATLRNDPGLARRGRCRARSPVCSARSRRLARSTSPRSTNSNRRERKGFLDAQSEDLTQAMETLENAIRRIDRETRDLLQSTYDAVNKSFGELFPIPFGGGEAG